MHGAGRFLYEVGQSIAANRCRRRHGVQGWIVSLEEIGGRDDWIADAATA